MVPRLAREFWAGLACTGVTLFAFSCENPNGDVATRTSALVGDPIESVQQVEGVAPVTIDNVQSPPDGGTIDQTSFTIGLSDEDETTLCSHPGSSVCIRPDGSGYGCFCAIMSDLNPEHPFILPLTSAFDDVSVVEVTVNVGSARAMHWDWLFRAYYQAPFGEFWAEVVDQNGVTTIVTDKISAPAPWGFRFPFAPAMPAFTTGPQHVDLDLSPWSDQKIRARFFLHSSYDPEFFATPPCGEACAGGFDAGTSKAYVSNLHVDTCAVTSVELLDVDSPIDDNPKFLGGGRRVFVGKQSPSDGSLHDTIRVVAHTSLPNCPVTLRSFDVDDPSDNSDIDPKGPAGGDNYLGKRGDFLPAFGDQMTLSSASDNQAVTGFVVSRQPGDNFLIIASSNQDQVSRAKMTVVDGKFAIVDAAGNAVPNRSIVTSPMLTVWRRLHVQVDSMSQVTTNHVNGVITRALTLVSSGTALSSVDVSIPLLQRRFNNGRIEFNAKSFTVSRNDAFSIVIDDPAGNLSQSDVGATFVLYDDDNLEGSNQTLLHGDEGFEISAPDLALLADSDEPSLNIFAPAYIRPIYDTPGDRARPFVLNLEDNNNPFAGQMDVTGPDYWFVYLLGAYQGPVRRSADPRHDDLQGRSLHGQGSMMFHETIRDLGETPLDNGATTTVHEIGHLLGAKHGQRGIMGDDAAGSKITEVVLKPRSIRSVRRLVSP